ncbi:rap guanine nucleotide exchange factor 4 [Caerostris darwini]|uniref:Rap guanine nucleotide exchange factor 4 n=1 Tax=Caerostris darwini TaxID=1538125 RepID=A0AAV4R485_9ARAC|nr:rap guanine nucleotide exchange factor 4 [Caerostris darwini]
MVTEWAHIMDKRPADRTEEELEVIYNRLRSIDAFEKYHPSLLQQMCYFGYYEDLDKGVTLFRQGDKGTNWYAVLAGSLDVQVLQPSPEEVRIFMTLTTMFYSNIISIIDGSYKFVSVF